MSDREGTLEGRLLEWFFRHGRALPWRRERSPYRVWLAEVMLQQTQVATVIPYYERWLKRFPDIHSLAAAPLSEVLKLWEGLGYYRRARLLHQAACELVATRGGKLPERAEDLRKLPGVGAYTAAAVASLAFGERVLAVDGNVRRVAARLFALPRPSEKEVRAALTRFLPEGAGAGAFNEALMDLGRTVCTPRAPRCEACPLHAHCAAFKTGRAEVFPAPGARKVPPFVRKLALVYRRGETLWLYRRPEEEMLGGLWGFVLADPCAGPPGSLLPPVRHAYSHFRLEVRPLLAETPPTGEGRWLSPEELAALPMSRLDHKILEAVGREAQAEEQSAMLG